MITQNALSSKSIPQISYYYPLSPCMTSPEQPSNYKGKFSKEQVGSIINTLSLISEEPSMQGNNPTFLRLMHFSTLT